MRIKKLLKPTTIILTRLFQKCISLSAPSSSSLLTKSRNLRVAVLVPGFLTGADEFNTLCAEILTKKYKIPTISIPMPNYHWIPCLGGRSARPILERIDYTIQHVIANHGDVTEVPKYDYSIRDLWVDFWTNPGGVAKVGGSDDVDYYPDDIIPQGKFEFPSKEQIPRLKIALIGHSAGGWISRVYCSSQNYGGKCYNGQKYVHSLITLGTPHATAPGPAFSGIKWINNIDNTDSKSSTNYVRKLAVGGVGFEGGDTWGSLTKGSYGFCCPDGSDGSQYDGDGVTPLFSSLGMPHSDQLVVEGVTHFCWGDVFGSDFVAPELTKDYIENNRLWYGSEEIVEQWVSWLNQGDYADSDEDIN